MIDQPWTENLLYLLKWTQKTVNSRTMKRKPFSLLINQNHELLEGLPIIKITGTNGKGSVCAMLESCLLQDHNKTGLFTSPHLVSVTERIRVNGQAIALSLMEKQAKALKPNLISVVKEQGDEYRPSFFEVLILIALRVFKEAQVDIAIFEAGIGGYNDSTSLLPEIIGAITTVGKDHEVLLGNTLEQIAFDKTGITQAHSTLVVGPRIQGKVLEVIKTECQARNVALIPTPVENITVIDHSLNGTVLRLTHQQLDLTIALKLVGHHQVDNFAVVVAILNELFKQGRVTNLQILKAVNQVSWPGRLEYIDSQPRWLLDAAHNPHALKTIQKTLDALIPYHNRVILYGVSSEKDYKSCLELIGGMAPDIYLVTGFYRARQSDDLSSQLPQSAGTFANTQEAIKELTKRYGSDTDKIIIVVGSVFLVGEMREYLMGE